MFPSTCSHPAWMNIENSTDSGGHLSYVGLLT
jgi:hypothetical protein